MKKFNSIPLNESALKENETDKALDFTKNLVNILSVNMKNINKKDIDYIFNNIYYAIVSDK